MMFKTKQRPVTLNTLSVAFFLEKRIVHIIRAINLPVPSLIGYEISAVYFEESQRGICALKSHISLGRSGMSCLAVTRVCSLSLGGREVDCTYRTRWKVGGREC